METLSVRESTPVVAGISPNTHPPDLESPRITLVDASTFAKACKLDGSAQQPSKIPVYTPTHVISKDEEEALEKAEKCWDKYQKR